MFLAHNSTGKHCFKLQNEGREGRDELVIKDVLLSLGVVLVGMTSLVFLTFFMYVILCHDSLTALANYLQWFVLKIYI